MNKDIYILLRAKDMASKTIKGVNKQIGTLGTAGAKAGAALKTAAIGAAAIGTTIVVANIKSGIDSLAELESATTSVQGAIEQMGLAGQITSGQVADWANEIENATDAAFDDKAITRATTTLIRYGSVAPKNLRKTMEVMTDLAAKTGDVESASTLLAKALADPAKAAGKLARMGIVLTKAEQDQIKAMVKAGDAAGAQAKLLDILAQKTTGAAKASAGPYRDAMNKMADAVEDAQRALAIGFLPVIEEVADWLGRELVKPSTIASIKEFGKGLAGGLKAAVTWAKQLPWGEITAGLKAAAGFAKGMIDAFMAMPTEVKGIIIALAGLNKLTGGAVGSIVGELGKGLIKGVLGMTAGVVNINAGVVNGGGLPTGGAGAAGGSALSSTIKGAARLILPFLPAAIAIGASEALQAQRREQVANTGTAELKAMKAALVARMDKGIGYMGARRTEADRQTAAMIDAELTSRGVLTGTIGKVGAQTQTAINRGNSMLALVRAGVGNVAVGLGATKSTLNAAIGTVRTAVGGVSTKTGMALTSLSRINTSTQGVRTAVANKKMAVTVNVKNAVSVRTFVEQARVRSTYDSNSSSGYVFR